MTLEIEGIEKAGKGRNLRAKLLAFCPDTSIRVVKMGIVSS